MSLKPLFLFLPFAAFILGCSDGDVEVVNALTGGSSGSSSSGSSGSGSSSSGAPAGETVTITMDSFEIPPGGEVFKCQNFVNPFGGDVEVSTFESHMTPGSHHLLLFYRDDVAMNGPLEDCSGLEFDATPYSTQLPDDSVAFPPGIAAAIPATTGLRTQSHYLNTTGSTIKAEVKITFHLAKPGTVTDHAGVMFVIQPKIFVGPNSTQEVGYDCNVPFDMSVMKASSHMHKHGTHFTSTVGGQTLYQTDIWDEPKPAVFDPPMALKAGDPLHFACTFQNNSTNFLTFGESAESNEMCILVASFYPVPDGTTTINCK